MKTKTLKAYLSILVAFSLALSSCDKKNALLVNRRTATFERMEEIREDQTQGQAPGAGGQGYVVNVPPQDQGQPRDQGQAQDQSRQP